MASAVPHARWIKAGAQGPRFGDPRGPHANIPAMLRAFTLVALGTGLLPGATGCTAIVVDNLLAEEVPCEAPGDCGAGFACTEGLCRFVEEVGQPPPEDLVVGAAGGEITGPDGVSLSIPAGALGGDTALRLERASSTHVPVGCQEASAFYLVTPEVDFAAAATLSIPVSDCGDCRVFERPATEGAWTELAEPDVAPTGAAAALIEHTGAVLVAGVPQ